MMHGTFRGSEPEPEPGRPLAQLVVDCAVAFAVGFAIVTLMFG